MRRILYPAPATFDLLQYGQDVLIDEILKRTALMMGTFDSSISAYGIVDASDPRTAITGGTRPFSVNVDTTLPNTVNVIGGTAVFKSGEIIVIDETISQLSLADNTPNVRNIIYLEFDEEEMEPVLTRHNVLTNSKVDFLSTAADYVKVLTKDDYDALDPTAKDLTIPLAMVTVQTIAAVGGGTTTRLSVDMSRTSFASNRPWFSVADAEHRSHLGTGAVTSVNVHGLSINDLSAAGDLTFLQVALDHGMIVSKDQGLAGVPGTICTETIPAAAVYNDTTGLVTGITNARYFRLSRVPTQVLRVELPLPATGKITVTIGAGDTIDEGSYFILNDGKNPAVRFTFDAGNVGITETNTSRKISILGSEDTAAMRDKILDAINNAPALLITASAGSTPGEILLVNDETGEHGNQPILETVGDAIVNNTAFVATGMSGGVVHELAPFWVPGSNLVALLPSDEFVSKGGSTHDLVVHSAVVDAAEPVLATVNQTFKVRAAATNEVLVSGGLFLPRINNTELTFENAGPIPANYTVYVDSAGTLQYFPQTVFCYKTLNEIGFALQSFDFQMVGPAQLKVFLADAAAGPNLDVQVQITGTDVNGVTVTETVKFDSTWAETAAGGASENPNQSKTTETVFASGTNVIVSARNNDGPNTTIMIQALVDPVNTPLLANVLPVAEIFWNGFQVVGTDVRDIRPINTSLQPLDYMPVAAAAGVTAEVAASQASSGVLFHYWAEDFNKPRYVTTKVTDTDSPVEPQSTKLTKLTKGLGRNDVYISRPIPVKPYDGNATSLRFIPIQPGKDFSIKARYYDSTSDEWSPWVSSTSAPFFTSPGYTIALSGTGVKKWQMVVTGPVEGIYVVLTTSTGANGSSFQFDSGAWPKGVLI